MGSERTRHGVDRLSVYLLDTTVLVAQLRGNAEISGFLRKLVAAGHALATSCVNVAEVERGVRSSEKKAAAFLLTRLRFLETTRDAALRAGRYQADFASRGRTIQTPDALVAGTARAHGAIVLTENTRDFPMRDIRVEAPPGA